MSERILEFVLKVSGRNIEGVWKASWWCLEVVWKVWKRCLEGLRNGRGLWIIKIFLSLRVFFRSFSHGLVLIQNYPQINFLPWKSSCLQMNECKYANMVCKYAIIQFCKKNYQSFLTWVCNYATIHTILWSAQKKGLKRKENSSVALLSPTCCCQAQPQLQMGWVGFILS